MVKAINPEISVLIGSAGQCLFLCGSNAEARRVAKVNTTTYGAPTGEMWSRQTTR
jgi:hypothetical protein